MYQHLLYAAFCLHLGACVAYCGKRTICVGVFVFVCIQHTCKEEQWLPGGGILTRQGYLSQVQFGGSLSKRYCEWKRFCRQKAMGSCWKAEGQPIQSHCYFSALTCGNLNVCLLFRTDLSSTWLKLILLHLLIPTVCCLVPAAIIQEMSLTCRMTGSQRCKAVAWKQNKEMKADQHWNTLKKHS